MKKDKIWKIKIFTKYILIDIPLSITHQIHQTITKTTKELTKKIPLSAIITITSIITYGQGHKTASIILSISALLLLLSWIWESGIYIHEYRKKYKRRAKWKNKQ